MSASLEPMAEARFWQLIDGVRATTGSRQEELDDFIAELRDRLEALTPTELIGFELTMRELEARAYSWDLWGAGYLINGGCSDDGFVYFRRGLLAQGRQTWEAALRDPETLADALEAGEELELEELGYVAGEVYRTRTGRDLWDDLPLAKGPREPPRPTGTDWTEEDLPRRFPRLAARYG